MALQHFVVVPIVSIGPKLGSVGLLDYWPRNRWYTVVKTLIKETTIQQPFMQNRYYSTRDFERRKSLCLVGENSQLKRPSWHIPTGENKFYQSPPPKKKSTFSVCCRSRTTLNTVIFCCFGGGKRPLKSTCRPRPDFTITELTSFVRVIAYNDSSLKRQEHCVTDKHTTSCTNVTL